MKDLKIFTNNIEEKAREQINLLLEQEAFKDCKVRIMPDVHAGSGCVIGFTADLGDKVIPNVVGVDIGCGMTWVRLENKEIDLVLLDKVIREQIDNYPAHSLNCMMNILGTHDTPRILTVLGKRGNIKDRKSVV